MHQAPGAYGARAARLCLHRKSCNLLHIAAIFYMYDGHRTTTLCQSPIMPPPTKRIIADFKIRPTSALPIRPGPLQCIRNCPSCTSRQHQNAVEADQEQNQNDNRPSHDESMDHIKSYENLLLKRVIPFCPYQSVQYHPGQFDLLRRNLNSERASRIVYIVAMNDLKDLYYFRQVIEHVQLEPRPKAIASKTLNLLDSTDPALVIPLHYRSCFTHTKDVSSANLFNIRNVADILGPFVDKCQLEPEFNFRIVPCAITKDHNRSLPFGIGSICIQVHEPYSAQNYLKMINSLDPSDHIARHILHDIATNIPLLPTHIIAFLLLNLDRDAGPSFRDLVEYYKWFDRNRMGLNLHFAFTGEAESIVSFALFVLKDSICSEGGTYRVTNIEALMAYANILVPNIAPLGLLARAVLIANNACENNDMILKFEPNLKLRVLKDVTMDTFLGLAEEIESVIPLRRPCNRLEDFVDRTLDNVQTHFRFFRLEIPMRFKRDNAQTRWGFDIEEDEIYREAQINNPIFKDWINVTQRVYRLDQLNLFVNALELPLSYPSSDCISIEEGLFE